MPLYEQVAPASSCQNEVILPWTKDKIDDKTFPATGPVYEESLKALPGLAGESRSGDANGQWFRVLLDGAELRLPDRRPASSSSPASRSGRQPAAPAPRVRR